MLMQTSLLNCHVALKTDSSVGCWYAQALHRLGKDDVPVYDGSWTEWGSLSATDAPVETNVGATSA
jgi:hypothetical protein